ncbi:MAG: PspA/IM30 family protein [Chloroflexota bacterium]
MKIFTCERQPNSERYISAMKWSQRLRLALQTFLKDIFSEEVAPANNSTSMHAADELLSQVIAKAQTRLDTLRVELANAQSHQKRIELDWQQTQAQAQAMSDAVDHALQAGQDDLARYKLIQTQALEKRVQELYELNQSYAQWVSMLREAVYTQQARLESTQRKAHDLLHRERSAETLEELSNLRRELDRQMNTLQTDLRARQEQLERREDRIAARQEINRRNESRE